MPAFDDEVVIAAPPEEVWKLLYDPSRFPEWIQGLASVTDVRDDGGATAFTQYPDGYPDFPMAQRLTADRSGGRVVISCLVSDLEYRWTLGEEPGGHTRLGVHVEIPEAEAVRLDDQRRGIAESIAKLREIAEREAS